MRRFRRTALIGTVAGLLALSMGSSAQASNAHPARHEVRVRAARMERIAEARALSLREEAKDRARGLRRELREGIITPAQAQALAMRLRHEVSVEAQELRQDAQRHVAALRREVRRHR